MRKELEYHSPPRRSNPASLTVVGGLFIAVGSIGVGSMIVNPMLGRGITVDFCSPFLIIWGAGLLRKIRSCYDMAIFVLGASMASCVVAAMVPLLGGAPDGSFYGKAISPAWLQLSIYYVLIAGAFLICLWQFRTLRRPEIKRLF